MKAPVGHFFDVMTNGFGAMPSYASRVEPDDRWRIAAYIRVLQLSQNAHARRRAGGPARRDSTRTRRHRPTAGDGARNDARHDPVDVQHRLNGSESRCWWASPALLLAIAGFLLDREQFLRSYLFAYLFWIGMALGCLGILLLHHTVGGKWGMMIRRMCEAGARTLPYMIVLLIPVLVSMPALYVWARPEAAHDANIQAKAAYLNVPGVLAARRFSISLVWTFYAWRLTSGRPSRIATGDPEQSDRQDAGGQRAGTGGVHVRHHVCLHRLDHVAGAALVLDHLRSRCS